MRAPGRDEIFDFSNDVLFKIMCDQGACDRDLGVSSIQGIAKADGSIRGD
jgi:hypothetical protein